MVKEDGTKKVPRFIKLLATRGFAEEKSYEGGKLHKITDHQLIILSHPVKEDASENSLLPPPSLIS